MTLTHTTTEIPESHRYLLDTDVAVLATVGPDGMPQQSAVWFVAENDTISISLNNTRQKTKNLTRDTVCDLLILDRANPYKYLEVRGRAIVEPDPDYGLARRVESKYNAKLSEHDGKGETRVWVTIQPTRVNAVDMTQG
jgi:PPOX class probable F420-dependent enzyme